MPHRALVVMVNCVLCSTCFAGYSVGGDYATSTYYVGKQTEPVQGTANIGVGFTFIANTGFSTVPTTINEIEFYTGSDGTGTAKIIFYTKSGNDFTAVHSESFSISSGNTLLQYSAPGDFTAFEVPADCYVGAYSADAELMRENSIAGAGHWWYNGDTSTGTTTMNADTSSQRQLQVRAIGLG